MADQLVLVTGGSGFIGSHCILQLLERGYRVRTTIRSRNKEQDVIKMLKVGGAKSTSRLEFTVADLTKDEGWPDAVRGCTYVLHVASPFPPTRPKSENDIIIPAREGTMRVLKAASTAGVKRVVLTSSFAAIGYGHKSLDRVFTEADWSDLHGPDISPYDKSKVIAEKAAWDFVSKKGSSLELSVINPVGVFGPVLGPDFSTSIILVQSLLAGKMPGFPQYELGVVDVRDLVNLHLRAMIDPKAVNERFIAGSGEFQSVQQMGKALVDGLGKEASNVPTRVMPNILLKMIGMLDPQVAYIVPELGKMRRADTMKAQRLLGWSPRSPEDALVATGRSLIKLGIVKT